MNATTCKILDFPAAHRNTRHEGHCNRVHGHTWTLEIYCHGPVCEDPESSAYGMVVDFQDLKDAYRRRIEEKVEHQFLNESLPILEEFTTEIIAGWILSELRKDISTITKVRLWEGKTSFVEVNCGDLLKGNPKNGRKEIS